MATHVAAWSECYAEAQWHAPVQDVDVCGYQIPAGTNIGLSVFSLHLSTDAWGADAREWRPERWLEARSINAAKRDAAGHLRWVPFLHGAQNCIGQHLALVRPRMCFVEALLCCLPHSTCTPVRNKQSRVQMELKLAVAVLVSLMHISLDTSKMAATTPAELLASVQVFVVAFVAGGVHLNMTPRCQAATSS